MARILLADDANFMKLIQREIIEKAGHTIVAEAANGTEAVALYKELSPDLVIMDINMPEMNGLNAMKTILESDNAARVIVVSAMGAPKFIKQAIEAGATDFIVKPFKRERIQDSINKALGLV